MKHTTLILMLAASTFAVSAQTPAKPAAPASKPAVHAAKPTAPPVKSAAAQSPYIAAVITAPLNKCGQDFCVPPHKGRQKTVFTVALRYQDIQPGDGPVAELNKLFKVNYTGYRAVDGVKFDSSYDHPGAPLRDKDGKPIMGEDGKPKMGPPQPASFPQGRGVFIDGFDQGVVGMRKGGVRRIFIPWQLGYGTREIPDRPGHPGIPSKSDLIFDVELVDVADMPEPQMHPGMPQGMHMMPPNGQHMPPKPGSPGAPVQMMTAPKPPVPGAAPNAVTPATPTAPGAAPKPAAPQTPPTAPATTPAAPAQPQSK